MPPTADPLVRSAARWFWWIAGLSLVNTALFHSGSNTNFVVGLAMTTVANVLFAKALPIALGLTALTVGFYAWIGLMAQRERLWAFYLGLVVYIVDALIYMHFDDWMPVAFHGLAIFYILRGIGRLRARPAEALA